MTTGHKKRPGGLPDLGWYLLSSLPVHPWSKESSYRLDSLKIAGRHLTRLVIALEVEANLLAFDDFAHSGALDGRDVNEGVSAAIVGLDESRSPWWN